MNLGLHVSVSRVGCSKAIFLHIFHLFHYLCILELDLRIEVDVPRRVKRVLLARNLYSRAVAEHSYNNGEEESEYYLQGNLTIDFHQYVKVSKSYWEYDAIELIAEVGGYVGLFLGVSVNQIRLPIGRLFTS